MQFIKDGNTLVFKINGETVRIEPWGKNSLRVRSTMLRDFTGCDWALTEKTAECAADVKLYEAEYHGDGWGKCMRQQASITNGRLRAEVNFAGVISFYRDDALILREYFRSYGGTEPVPPFFFCPWKRNRKKPRAQIIRIIAERAGIN